ncbi:MAG: glycosyltransferase family 2 protein [Magnetospiraceae bacterium]
MTRIAVMVPCYNEEASIPAVIRDFRTALPGAAIYIYDNNSTDRTAEVAAAAGAIVRAEPLRGKGNVVRRMLADIEADVYVMVDGDDTYEAAAAPRLIDRLLTDNLDMVTGRRITDIKEAYRPGHRLGNRVLTGLVAQTFGNRSADMLSGYRVFSRRFAKSFPAQSSGFEIETELTVHALEMRLPIADVDTVYKDRPEGSVSKLNTYRDGIRILRTIFYFIKEERPLAFFSLLAGFLALISVIISVPLLFTYLETGLVPRFPTAILATGLMVIGMLSLTCGLILDTVTLGRREMKRLAYLRYRAPGAAESDPT